MPTLSAEGLVLDREAYLAVRSDLRARMIPVRATRRVRLGDRLAVEFENAETLRYQVQEMLMVEGVLDDAGVEHELAAYSRFLPGPSRLTATFFVECSSSAAARSELEALAGVQHAVRLEIGGTEPTIVPGVEIPGPDEDGPSTETSAVHFLGFDLDEAARRAFTDPTVPVALAVEHPSYADGVRLGEATRTALIADLAG